MFRTTLLTGTAAAALLAAPAFAQSVSVGHLVDFTGATSGVGVPFGNGVADAIRYMQQQGGIAGLDIEYEQADYGYQAPRAVATYRRFVSQNDVDAVQGWGTADTEALVEFVARDQVPYFSASYSGTLTDPTGTAPRATKAAPYNFFYGPSYSDACRALVQWAYQDWQAEGEEGAPKFVHMGDNHPYPNSPKAACAEYAEELGFEVLDPITYTLAPGDFTAQCLTLKENEADYAFLANTGGSGISLLPTCKQVGVETQFMSNVWGMDENVMRAAGDAADGHVFVVRTGTTWNGEAPGLELVREISAVGDPNADYRPLHYIAGICSAYYMKEAIAWAAENGGVSGETIRDGMYALSEQHDMAWVPEGLEGVCLPSGWTPEDHRGTMTAMIYRANVTGSTEGKEVSTLMGDGTMSLEKLAEIELERRPEWLGY